MGQQTEDQDCFDSVIHSWLAHMGELLFKAGGLSTLFTLTLLLLKAESTAALF